MTNTASPLGDRRWRLRNSVWLLVPILGFGFFTVFAVARIAFRTGDPHLKKVAAAYVPPTALLWVSLALTNEAVDDAWSNVAAGMMLVLWLGGSVHCATAVNRRHLRWRATSGSRPWYEQQAPSHSREQSDSPASSADPFGLQGARQGFLAPGPAPDDAGGMVDLNTASEGTLAQIAGVGPVLAKRIVHEREARGGFSSVHELAEIGVPPHVLARLRAQVTLSPRRAVPPPSRGRVLDL